jgi:hypothetical protein
MATLSKQQSIAQAQANQGGRTVKGGGGATTVRPVPNHALAIASANALVASGHPDTIKNETLATQQVAQLQSRSSYGGGGALTGVTTTVPRTVEASLPAGSRPAPTTNDTLPLPAARDVRPANKNIWSD